MISDDTVESRPTNDAEHGTFGGYHTKNIFFIKGHNSAQKKINNKNVKYAQGREIPIRLNQSCNICFKLH